ncbi:MAG TPA: 50S ribosomal protein L6 [Spirochaetota bacterium]|nr:50S ribosomal protein L6 [Spirochaetota bacterium]HOS55053.1 50S ribosomal protein L6 [Spirochaetota bacterium]HPK62496.1 50S ribosomal protein L6 [Spirochaetota bacterium]HQF77707.1 50S ribosomal protein L6 [Spirochaetota bacterium]HQH30729.1 50S ribosomal protein L6 [Spirochaetota bacterium]
MSRIGRLPIEIPAQAKVTNSGNKVVVEGPKGKMELDINSDILVKNEANRLIIGRKSDEKSVRAAHGLYRMLIQNMVKGVTTGFEKRLEISGTGFKAAVEGQNLVLNLGYSHVIKYPIPKEVKVAVEENVKIIVSGIDKHLVGFVASEIRKLRKPEPYKGKGIKYSDEKIRRKAGKAAKK